MSFCQTLRLALCAGLLAGLGIGSAFAQDAVLCDAAGAGAEKQYGLPAGLLRAIGRIESGRRDPDTGRLAAWPWTINAEGRGQLLASQTEALAAVQTLQRSGTASIDVGCFQVNLMHHPQAFATLADGFDPQQNAGYAARLLVLLRTRTGSWEAAVGAYHSSTPEKGDPYRERVLASWVREGEDPASFAAATSLLAASSLTAASLAGAALPTTGAAVRVMDWSPSNAAKPGGMRIWTPSPIGQGASIIHITGG